MAALGPGCSVRASRCGGFPCCAARAPGAWASAAAARGLSSCGSRTLECRLSSRGARAQLLCGMWDLPGPGLKPVCPALAGRLLTTAPPGKPYLLYFELTFVCGVRQGTNEPFSNCPSTIWRRHYPFPSEGQWHLCWKPNDPKSKGLFLDSRIGSIDLKVYLNAYNKRLDYCSFLVRFDVLNFQCML